MSWYVFALVDAAPSGAKGKGLSGPLALRPVPGGFAVVERRADVPPAEFGSLKRHHDVIDQLAGRVPAIIPVRFGTLLGDDTLEEVLDERMDEIAAAFAVVRDRVQFTWRREARGAGREGRGAGGEARGEPRGARREDRGPRREDRGAGGEARARREGREARMELRPSSGSEYLRRAAKAATPAPPAAWRALRTKLEPLVAAERYQAATAARPEALYHLVARDRTVRYSTMAAALCHADAALKMTGPWPPFAFAPEML